VLTAIVATSSYFLAVRGLKPSNEAFFFETTMYRLIVTGWVSLDRRCRALRLPFEFDAFMFFARIILLPYYISVSDSPSARSPLCGCHFGASCRASRHLGAGAAVILHRYRRLAESQGSLCPGGVSTLVPLTVVQTADNHDHLEDPVPSSIASGPRKRQDHAELRALFRVIGNAHPAFWPLRVHPHRHATRPVAGAQNQSTTAKGDSQ